MKIAQFVVCLILRTCGATWSTIAASLSQFLLPDTGAATPTSALRIAFRPKKGDMAT